MIYRATPTGSKPIQIHASMSVVSSPKYLAQGQCESPLVNADSFADSCVAWHGVMVCPHPPGLLHDGGRRAGAGRGHVGSLALKMVFTMGAEQVINLIVPGSIR